MLQFRPAMNQSKPARIVTPISVLRQLIRVATVLAAVLAGGELFVRMFVGGPSPQAYDPQIGYTYLPHSELFQTKEGHSRMRFNAQGLNDDEIGSKNGRCRIVVIGDSYTAALQVRKELNFTSIAEQLQPGLDVVNGGRDGLFIGDLHKVANRLMPVARPDLVVYVVSERAVEADIALPQFRIAFDADTGQIRDAVMQVEQQEKLKRIFGPILNHSALATRLSAQLKPAVVDAVHELESWRGDAGGSPTGIAGQPHKVPAPSEEDVLAFLFGRLRAGSPAALLFINGLSYSADGSARVAATSLAAEDLTRRAAQRAGIPIRSTGPYLIDAVSRTHQPPYGFSNALLPGGHLNERGHRAVAHALVDLLHDVRPLPTPECNGP